MARDGPTTYDLERKWGMRINENFDSEMNYGGGNEEIERRDRVIDLVRFMVMNDYPKEVILKAIKTAQDNLKTF